MSQNIFGVTRERAEELKALLKLDQAALATLAAKGEPRPDARPRSGSGGTISLIPVYGFIEQRTSVFGALFGGTSTQWLGAMIRQSAADPNVRAIVLDVSSGGGSVFGVTELANEIMAARGSKPIVAQVNSFAGSAAYWICSAADQIIITPSGQAGSIGVFAIHQDFTGADEKAGIKTSVIAAGDHKADAAGIGPLSDAGRNALQETVNHIYNVFLRDVASGRGVSVAKVKADFGQGLMFTAPKAKAAGMVDGIGTLDSTISRLSTAAGRAAMIRPYNEAERLTRQMASIGAGRYDGEADRRARALEMIR